MLEKGHTQHTNLSTLVVENNNNNLTQGEYLTVVLH